MKTKRLSFPNIPGLSEADKKEIAHDLATFNATTWSRDIQQQERNIASVEGRLRRFAVSHVLQAIQ